MTASVLKKDPKHTRDRREWSLKENDDAGMLQVKQDKQKVAVVVKKRSETELTASILKKDLKHTRDRRGWSLEENDDESMLHPTLSQSCALFLLPASQHLTDTS